MSISLYMHLICEQQKTTGLWNNFGVAYTCTLY